MKENPPQMMSELLIDQTVIRGETLGIWLRDAASYRLRLRRSFLAVSEWLMLCEMQPDTMLSNLRLALELDQCTCLIGQGLLRSLYLDDQSGRALPIEIAAHGNVISCGRGSAMIEQVFSQESMDLRQPRFSWSSDRNQFDGMETLWLSRFESRSEEDRWNFDSWRSFWSSGEIDSLNNQELQWTANWRNRPWSQISPAAVLADLQVEAIAKGSILDEPEAGVSWDQLPPEPSASALP